MFAYKCAFACYALRYLIHRNKIILGIFKSSEAFKDKYVNKLSYIYKFITVIYLFYSCEEIITGRLSIESIFRYVVNKTIIVQFNLI